MISVVHLSNDMVYGFSLLDSFQQIRSQGAWNRKCVEDYLKLNNNYYYYYLLILGLLSYGVYFKIVL